MAVFEYFVFVKKKAPFSAISIGRNIDFLEFSIGDCLAPSRGDFTAEHAEIRRATPVTEENPTGGRLPPNGGNRYL